MDDMQTQTIATDVPVCQFVSCSFTRFCCAKTAEWIEVLGVKTVDYPRHCVGWGSQFPTAMGRSAFEAAFAKLLWLFVDVNVFDSVSSVVEVMSCMLAPVLQLPSEA